MSRRKVIIAGAAGRDFHNFNVYFRDNESYQVVAFTATQIPNISGRRYPADLAGKLYPEGIPIREEKDLASLINEHGVDEVVFAYSDVSHEYVMHLGSVANAAGADYTMMGARATMLKSRVPVVSICAVRTGCGKSQTTRKVCRILKEAGKKVVAIRHPMPYGDLSKQKVQRFAALEDMDHHECTIEEREEYEPHIMAGNVIYAGVDYGAILEQAEAEADVIVWDGGNNDLPFYEPTVEIVVADPHRPGHERSYYPGETNVRRAGVVVINKVSTADPENVKKVRESVKELNPSAMIIEADSPFTVEDAGAIKGKRVLAVEDGPTLTHGGMTYGAAVLAAKEHGAAEVVDPRPAVVGSIKSAFEKYPGIGPLLPALGYGEKQVQELQETIDRVDCDMILIGTPIDLRRLVTFKKPAQRVGYELRERGKPDLKDALAKVL